MDNSKFSNLLFRIIGRPETWQDEYIEVTNKIADEIGSFESEMFSELAIGDQFLSRMRDTNEAMSAFSTLLDKSRFKLIILDSNFKPIYHNQNAEDLHNRLLCTENPGVLNDELLEILRDTQSAALQQQEQGTLSGLMAIEYKPAPFNEPEENKIEQIYLRSIKNQSAQIQFNVLLMLDQSRQTSALNPDLTARYELTDKEQMVLINLIHGKSIKTISSESYISENTVKTHLKSLFRKTDTKSQTDLVGLILTHESQILNSYFDAPSPVTSQAEQAKDLLVKLNDGTEIVYREYGPSDGYPVIVCHNGYGCRITVPNDHEEICRKLNRRIIIPDRPGFGKTPFTADQPKSWSELLKEFIDELTIDEYDLLGTVLGCPMAIDFAAQADQRLKHLILSSPVFINNKDDLQYMQGILSPTARLVNASERFARETYQLWLKSFSLNLGSNYRSMVEASLGSAERKLFTEQNRLEQTLDIMVDSFREGISNSLDGITNELVFCLTPRNLDLSAIDIPVSLWWGSEDNRVSREGVQNLAAQFKDSTIHLKEGYTEHIYYAFFEEMISVNGYHSNG